MRPPTCAEGASMQTGSWRSGSGTMTGTGRTGVSRSGVSSTQTALVTPGDAHTCPAAPVIIMTASNRVMIRTTTISIYDLIGSCPLLARRNLARFAAHLRKTGGWRWGSEPAITAREQRHQVRSDGCQSCSAGSPYTPR
jgi:hypothetical protein